MTACGKGVRILSPRFADKICIQDETSGLEIEKIKTCVGPDLFEFLANGDLPAFRQLVADGCDFSSYQQPRHGGNILHLAVLCCGLNRSVGLNFVKFVVSKKIVAIDSQTFVGYTALLVAARTGDVDIMKFLVGEHCNVSITNGKGRNILHMAVKWNQLNVVKYILENDLIDIHDADNKGKTPLDLARMLGRTKIKTLLMAK